MAIIELADTFYSAFDFHAILLLVTSSVLICIFEIVDVSSLECRVGADK